MSQTESLLRRSALRAFTRALPQLTPVACQALESVPTALRRGAWDAALRTMDRAWRTLPDDAATFAPLYARLLSLGSADALAALRMLERALSIRSEAELAALKVRSLLQLQRLQEARAALSTALQSFCVERGGLLERIAGESLHQTKLQATGWLGLDHTLQVIGEVSAAQEVSALRVRLSDSLEFAQLLPTARAAVRRFRFQLPQPARSGALEVLCHSEPLLGSGLQLPLDFALDGRTQCRGTHLSGWVRLGWRPQQRLRLRLTNEHGQRIQHRSDPPQPDGRCSFSLDLADAALTGQRLELAARLPDDRWQPLPDTPLLRGSTARSDEAATRLSAWRTPRAAARQSPRTLRAPATDVIIPVYRGLDESLACIESVLGSVPAGTAVIVVDDATPEHELAAALDTLKGDGRITLLRHALNQGFVASVNEALTLHPTHDAVLLNADAQVFGDWLARLRRAAYSARKVASVTPLSNQGTIASYAEEAMSAATAGALHTLTAATLSGVRAPIPVGVGFCLYLRRDALSELGAFDQAAFGRGYGEETDYCLRARVRGWTHLLAADVFVHHAGARSFGSTRGARLDRARRLVNLRYPGYDRLIDGFIASNPLHRLRRRLDEARLRAFEGRFVLFVSMRLAGGVDRFVAERCRALRLQGLYPLLLRPAEVGDTKRCELWTDALSVNDLQYAVPTELSSLRALLRHLKISRVELQHFLHLDARVIELVRRLGVPYDAFIHDYAWICPRVTLMDGSGSYCGEPAVQQCERCVRRHGSQLGHPIRVAALRERSARWLQSATRVMAPSHDAASRLQRYVTGLSIEVQPYSVPVPAGSVNAEPAARGDSTVRVALIGALGNHKGYRILKACARDARQRALPLEFVVIGYTQRDAPLLDTGRVFITGRYSEAEAHYLLQRERPALAFFPSVTPETWCYALDHALSAGLPVAAFDLGAFAERLHGRADALLLSPTLQAPEINDTLLQWAAAFEPGIHTNMKRSKPGKVKSVEAVPPASAPAADALSASIQVLPMPPGLYLFAVQSALPAPARGGELSLPAVHVAIAPGTSADQVQFVDGPSRHGTWLFAPGDLVIARVGGEGCTMLLTSVRNASGEALSIKIERLEARTSNPAVPEPAATPAPAGPKPRSNGAVPLQVAAHIRGRGDQTYVEAPWAGRAAPGLWIEAFSIRPLKYFKPQDIEYKALTGSGFETPWLSDEQACGTKGMATPLVGFAVRLKPSATAASYDCEYSGYFQSGVTVGPLRNGAPCRSNVANDPLEGIQVNIVRRSSGLPITGAGKSRLRAKSGRKRAVASQRS